MIWYTVFIGDGEDFEDYETSEEAHARAEELCKQGIDAVVGWTD